MLQEAFEMKLRIRSWRLITQFLGLLFANGMLFGIPLFGSSELLRNFYLPNASTKFFFDAPTYSIFYKVQDTLVSGWDSMYGDLVLPLLIFVVLVLLLGRVWCAWLCPLGLPQDLLSMLRRRLGIKYLEMPPDWADLLHSMKYLALVLIIFYTFALGAGFLGIKEFRTALPLVYEVLDPNRAFYVYIQMPLGLAPLSTYIPWLSVLTTLFFLFTCFFVRRFWCHICPAGSMMSFLNRSALIKLRKDPAKCTHCRICYRVCPMEILKVYEERKQRDVSSSKCIHCYTCVDNCPEDGCLSVEYLNKRILCSKYKSQSEDVMQRRSRDERMVGSEA